MDLSDSLYVSLSKPEWPRFELEAGVMPIHWITVANLTVFSVAAELSTWRLASS
jgi:hypothetical protein